MEDNSKVKVTYLKRAHLLLVSDTAQNAQSLKSTGLQDSIKCKDFKKMHAYGVFKGYIQNIPKPKLLMLRGKDSQNQN